MECSPVKIPRTIAAALAVSALALSGVIAVAAPAAAHTPAASATCSDLTVTLVSYEGNGYNTTNNVKVVIDNTQVVDEWFGYSWSRTVSLGDKTVAHTWKVVIDAAGYNYDKTFTGTSTPCTPPPPSVDAAAAVTVTEPTCTSPAELILGTVTNATWSTPTATTGPADYSVTATATTGHAFAGNEPTKTFTGTLADKLPAGVAPCVTPPVDPPMPPQPDPVKTVEVIEVAHCDTDEIVTTTTTTTTGTVENPDGSPTWVSTTPIVLVTQTTRVADSETCPDPDFTAGGGGGAGAGGTLATTGVDLGWAPWIAGLLALAGSGVLFYPRLRTALRR